MMNLLGSFVGDSNKMDGQVSRAASWTRDELKLHIGGRAAAGNKYARAVERNIAQEHVLDYKSCHGLTLPRRRLWCVE